MTDGAQSSSQHFSRVCTTQRLCHSRMPEAMDVGANRLRLVTLGPERKQLSHEAGQCIVPTKETLLVNSIPLPVLNMR
jgi:hypothetical protein